MSVNVNINTPTLIDINAAANGGLGPWIINMDNSITHNNDLGSYIDKELPQLIVGDTYRVTYTISSFTSCQVRVDFGDNTGFIKNMAGTFVEEFVLRGQKKIRFYSNGTATINHYKIEHLATTLVDTHIANSSLVNNSFTLSYNPMLNQWISFHSYLPNNYIIHTNGALTKRNDTQLLEMNKGAIGSYFDEDVKPFIIETIFNDTNSVRTQYFEKSMFTKTFDNITVNLLSTDSVGASTNKFFDKVILYNEYQCSGEIVLDMTNLTKKERNWNINKFSDLTNNSDNPLFSSKWSDISNAYPIDKVVNSAKIDNTKPWYQRGRLRDKFLSVRFISSNTTGNKLVCKFVSSVYRSSQR